MTKKNQGKKKKIKIPIDEKEGKEGGRGLEKYTERIENPVKTMKLIWI